RRTEKGPCARELHRMSARPGELVPVACDGLDERGVLSAVAAHVASAAQGTLFLEGADGLTAQGVAFVQRALASTWSAAADSGASASGPYRRRPELRVEPAALALSVNARDAAERLAAAGYVVHVPPLRERKEDLAAHCYALLSRFGRSDVVADFLYLLAL